MPERMVRPDSPPLELPELNFVITSRNMAARVQTFPGSVRGSRSGGAGLTDDILESADLFEMGTVMLDDVQPGRGQDKQVDLYVPGGAETEGRLLLYFDENGVMSFHRPEPVDRAPAPIRDGGRIAHFSVPIRRPVSEPSTRPGVRGIGGMVARKVLKVIGWKVVEMAARRVGPPLVRRWENKHRPTRALSRNDLFTPGAPARTEPVPPAERALLFIHGTFSRVASAFKGLDTDAEFLRQIEARYGPHIYGFDHATLATGVATNVMQLYQNLAPGVHHFDIICHSRGGLIARALRDLSPAQLGERFRLDAKRGSYGDDLWQLAEKWPNTAKGVEVRVGRIFFAATPNNGTVLAQPTHLQKYLEILMTAANLLPDMADISVDALLTVAKLLLTEVVPALPGLDDQQPDSSLLPLLQPAPLADDRAVQAHYEPPKGWQAVMRLTDAAADFVFGQEPNDLVVPTLGVSHWPGGSFGEPELLAYRAGQDVHHCNLFAQTDTRQRLLGWV